MYRTMGLFSFRQNGFALSFLMRQNSSFEQQEYAHNPFVMQVLKG
jgi:hypothetical protein